MLFIFPPPHGDPHLRAHHDGEDKGGEGRGSPSRHRLALLHCPGATFEKSVGIHKSVGANAILREIPQMSPISLNGTMGRFQNQKRD